MHTSDTLTSDHFRYARSGPSSQGRPMAASFASAFPDHHPQDRVLVFWDDLPAGLLGNAWAILALTTAYYDALRARFPQGGFFDYPQHFCIKADDHFDGRFDGPSFGSAAWGMIDIWPWTKWHAAPQDITLLVRRLLDLQAHRVFWPASWWRTPPAGLSSVGEASPRLPDYARRMLATSLKQVLLYGDDQPNLWIHAESVVEKEVEAAIARLPTMWGRPIAGGAMSMGVGIEPDANVSGASLSLDSKDGCESSGAADTAAASASVQARQHWLAVRRSEVARGAGAVYREVAVSDFLERYAGCFEPSAKISAWPPDRLERVGRIRIMRPSLGGLSVEPS